MGHCSDRKGRRRRERGEARGVCVCEGTRGGRGYRPGGEARGVRSARGERVR